MKWATPTPATSQIITCKTVFKPCYLREMPQGGKGQDLEAELQAPALT